MIIKTKSELIPEETSKVKFGAIYGGAGFPLLAALWAGLNGKWSIEPRPSFNIRTFRFNFKNVLYSTEINAFCDEYVDVIWGSPSCGEISSSTRSSKNAKTMQMKAFEDFEYVQFARQVLKRRPKVFILENIPSVKNFIQFNTTPAGFTLRHQLTFHEVPFYDYHIEEHIINPTHIGIPQVRPRLFIIGSLKPNIFLLKPPEEDYRDRLSIRKIFEELDELRKTTTLTNDSFPQHNEDKIERMKRIRPGEGLYGGSNNRRLDPDKCSPVIMGSSSRHIHPWEHRLLTIRENACLMGLPLDFIFDGSDNKCLDQVGKGIVPQVGSFILEQVKKFLENIEG